MNKGFTLIELLAVIVILAVIATITTVSVGKTLKDSKNSLSKTQQNNIEKAAEAYYLKEGMSEDVNCVNVSDLISKGYIESKEVIDPKTREPMNGSVKIVYEANQYSYEYSEDSCKLCILEEGTSKEIGAKYTCSLDTDRTFYVLETTGDNVSLLMEQNFTDDYIPKTVAWCTDGGNDNTTCKNISTTGDNAPEGKDYIGHITGVFNKKGVIVSFPTANQIYGAYTRTMPQWIYNYLKDTTNPVPGVSGYWTASPYDVGSSSNAWRVAYVGNVSTGSVYYVDRYGLRPVITISKSLLD